MQCGRHKSCFGMLWKESVWTCLSFNQARWSESGCPFASITRDSPKTNCWSPQTEIRASLHSFKRKARRLVPGEEAPLVRMFVRCLVSLLPCTWLVTQEQPLKFGNHCSFLLHHIPKIPFVRGLREPRLPLPASTGVLRLQASFRGWKARLDVHPKGPKERRLWRGQRGKEGDERKSF